MLGRRRADTVVGGGDAHVLEPWRETSRETTRGVADEVPWVEIGAHLGPMESSSRREPCLVIVDSHRYPSWSRSKVQSILCVVYETLVRDRLEPSTLPRFGSRGDLIVGEIKASDPLGSL